MSTQDSPVSAFLKELMRRHNRLPSQMAGDLGISHATVSRWLSGKDIPSTKSCRKLAEYAGVPLEMVFSVVGHLPKMSYKGAHEWPNFGEYVHQKYPDMDEDLIRMVEDLIEHRKGA